MTWLGIYRSSVSWLCEACIFACDKIRVDAVLGLHACVSHCENWTVKETMGEK